MYRIFFKDRIIRISEKLDINNASYKTINVDSLSSLMKIVKDFIDSDYNLCLYGDDVDGIWCNFKSCFDVRKAAGGLVFKDDSFLAIKRWGIWDLPKGHIEKGEDKAECAVREVAEETGISETSIVKEISTTYHIYLYDEIPILKISYWFAMEYHGNECLSPQFEEDITEAIWVPREDKERIIRNTYPSLYEIMDYV